jgi:hypothetical protein
MSFDRWRARLTGEKVPTFLQPDFDDEGYYRKPITEPKLAANGQRNGQKKIVGWESVAYFIDRGKLCGVIGDRDMAINEVTDESLWSWVVRHPISEELYRAVAERGEPWPDLHIDIASRDVVPNEPAVPAANRDVAKTDNKPPEELPPEVEHAQAIDSAIGAAPTKITSEAEAAVALGSKNRIAELRLAADKAGKAVYEPMYREYKKVQAVWSPIVARAVAAEGKIQTAVLTFRESERKRLAAIETKRLEAIRNAEIENERIAQLAIAAGRPEPAPAPAPEPAPVAQPVALAPTYGTRKLKEELKKFAIINDHLEVYLHFKDDADLKALLEKLTTNAIRSGATVPGATFREGLI